MCGASTGSQRSSLRSPSTAPGMSGIRSASSFPSRNTALSVPPLATRRSGSATNSGAWSATSARASSTSISTWSSWSRGAINSILVEQGAVGQVDSRRAPYGDAVVVAGAPEGVDAGADQLPRWPSVLVVVAVNLLPVIFLANGSWEPGDVLIAYWLENLVVGGFSVFKIMTARGHHRGRVGPDDHHDDADVRRAHRAPSVKTARSGPAGVLPGSSSCTSGCSRSCTASSPGCSPGRSGSPAHCLRGG